jgi:hypothetical protein
MLLEGPILLVTQQGFDNYFPAEGWYYLSPLGLSSYSLYVVSPLWLDVDRHYYLYANYMDNLSLLLSLKVLKGKNYLIFLVFVLMDVILYAIGYYGETVTLPRNYSLFLITPKYRFDKSCLYSITEVVFVDDLPN